MPPSPPPMDGYRRRPATRPPELSSGHPDGSLARDRTAAQHPAPVPLRATPAPGPHQFQAQLAQEAVKPSAVHA